MLLMLQVVSTTTETTDGSVSQEKQKILVLVLTIQYGLLEQTKKEVDMVSTDLTIAPTNGRKFQDLHSELMLIRMVMLGLQTIRNKSTPTMAKNGTDNQEVPMISVSELMELFGQLVLTELVVDLVFTERVQVHTPLNGLLCHSKVSTGNKMLSMNWFKVIIKLQLKEMAKKSGQLETSNAPTD
jgi:hypothetical protein